MRLQRAIIALGLGVLICPPAAGLTTEDVEYRSSGSRQKSIFESPFPASAFPPIQLDFVSVIRNKPRGTRTGIRCMTEVRRRGEPVRGVPIMMGGEILYDGGERTRALPTLSGSTNRAGQKTLVFPYRNELGSEVTLVMEGMLQGELEIDAMDTTCAIVQRANCNKSGTRACLGGRRFKVEVAARTAGGPVPGRLLDSSKTRARFSLSQSGSGDLLVQILHRCANNAHFWVLLSSSTRVPFDLTVTDTFSGTARAYTNPGPRRETVDVAAFATCP